MKKCILLIIGLLAVLLFSCESAKVKTDANAGVILFHTSIYAKPGISDKELEKARVNRGEAVTIIKKQALENGENWIMVKLADDETTGWINNQYVHNGKKWLITLTGKVDLHVRPDAQSQTRKSLPRGSQMLVLKEKGDWKKVSVGYKNDGWINTSEFVTGLKNYSISYDVYISGIGNCTIMSSSNLKPWNEYTYTPDNLFDGKMTTSWQEGVKGDGIGEWIEIDFKKAASFRAFLVNGLVSPQKYYQMNNRVRQIKLEYWTDYTKQSKLVQFEDKNYGKQLIGLLKNVTKMRIIIDSVYKGTKWDDTAISEIVINSQ